MVSDTPYSWRNEGTFTKGKSKWNASYLQKKA